MKFIFTGDIALGDHPKTVGYGFYSKYKSGIPMEKAVKIFPEGIEADIKFGNLEFVLDDGNFIKSNCCRGDLKFAKFLKSIGYNVLNVANNHIYQYGIEPFYKTVKCLDQLGISTCGRQNDFNGNNLIKVGNETAYFLGWSDRPRQYFTEKPPYNEFNMEECCHYIKKMSKIADIVCVSLHWGEEFVQIPRLEEKEIARNLIDAGARIVVGHHPHVTREIEEYNGGLIAYSLGNFIGDMLWDVKTKQTGCLFVEIEKNYMKNWKFIPANLDEDYFPKYFDETAEHAINENLLLRYKKLNDLLSKLHYDSLAKRSLRNHQFLTVIHLLKNLYKYPPGYVKEVLIDAFKTRINYLLARHQ